MNYSPKIIYFSSVTENTKHFVEKLSFPAERIGLMKADGELKVDAPYVLVIPTYGAGKGMAAIPKQVMRFLNDPYARRLCVGIIGGGNINFGTKYAAAADILSKKLTIPVLHRFELRGSATDVEIVENGVVNNWAKLLEFRNFGPDFQAVNAVKE